MGKIIQIKLEDVIREIDEKNLERFYTKGWRAVESIEAEIKAAQSSPKSAEVKPAKAAPKPNKKDIGV
jgi:hypothetical protein